MAKRKPKQHKSRWKPQPQPDRPPITAADEARVEHIKALEAAIYPPALQMWWGMSARRLLWMCDGERGIMVWPHGYLLCEPNEIVDWAVLPERRMSPARFFACLRHMAAYYGDKRTSANCRGSTSYPLFKKLHEKGYIEILEESAPYPRAGEHFHYLKLTFLPKAATAGLKGGDA